ncbi:hypothetical protein XENTR_v10021048 [Xenopus tropicalis]|nr:hypothetical protein XENTR_v10021048 [Xenopus tropicalis]
MPFQKYQPLYKSVKTSILLYKSMCLLAQCFLGIMVNDIAQIAGFLQSNELCLLSDYPPAKCFQSQGETEAQPALT